MRKAFQVWLVGLVGLGSLAGCGLFRNNCGDGRCATGSKHASNRKATPREIANAETKRRSDHVAVGQQSTPILPEVVESPAEGPPAPRRVERPAVEKTDVMAQEEEILRRELAALQAKMLTRGVDEMPRVEAAPILPPAPMKRAVEPMVAMPSAPMKPASEPIVVTSEADGPMAKPAIPEKERTVALKSMDIHYGHTDGFKSVTGQVQLYRKTWRLRYADVGQEDTYGGAVVLEGSADLSKLRDGCHVRVTGVLMPPTSRTGSAMYRVQTIEILD